MPSEPPKYISTRDQSKKYFLIRAKIILTNLLHNLTYLFIRLFRLLTQLFLEAIGKR